MNYESLEELFLAQKPHFDDSDAFMASLTKRLDAVEYLKQHQEATIRRYKMAMVVVFVVGIISCAVTMTLVLSTPANVPLFTFFDKPDGILDFPALNTIFLWITENSRIIAATGLSLLTTLGLFSIISNVQDLMNMRVNMNLS